MWSHKKKRIDDLIVILNKSYVHLIVIEKTEKKHRIWSKTICKLYRQIYIFTSDKLRKL